MATDLKEAAMLALVDRAASLGAGALVLRGGLVVRELIAPLRRPVDDVDFLALCNESDARGLLRAIVSGEGGGFHFRLGSIERTWVETDFPGLRTACTASSDVHAADLKVQIDIGFGDPRAQAEQSLKLPGGENAIAATALATMLGWKIHGIFERGDGGWRAKDLVDVYDLAVRSEDEDMAARCLRLAFESRGFDFAVCDRFLHGEWGLSRGSRRKWRQFRRQRAEFDPTRAFPEDLQEYVAALRRQVAPLIQAASKAK